MKNIIKVGFVALMVSSFSACIFGDKAKTPVDSTTTVKVDSTTKIITDSTKKDTVKVDTVKKDSTKKM